MCVLRSLVPDAARPSRRDRSPAVLWEHVLGRGARIELPKQRDVDLLGLVLEGRVALIAPEQGRAPRPEEPRTAFRVPGAGVSIEARGGPARLLLVASGGVRPLAAAVDLLERRPDAAAWSQRPGAIERIRLDGVGELAWGRRAYRAWIGFESPSSPRASLGVLWLARQAAVPEHVHANEWEHLAVLAGEGELVWKEGTTERRTPVRPGLVTRIPPATPHAYRPSGRSALLALQVYTPPGPEQRFKRLARPRD